MHPPLLTPSTGVPASHHSPPARPAACPQSLFPPPLAAQATAAAAAALAAYDDATCEAPVWEYSWARLGSALELALPLGRVACMAGQYAPLHVSTSGRLRRLGFQ